MRSSSSSSLSTRASPPTSSSRASLLAHDTSTTLFEQQNNALHDALHSKVAMLKSISIAIGDEVKAQNRLLEEADGDMGGVGLGMKGVVGRLGGMMQSGGSKHMLYLVLFICTMFFVVYFLKRWS